MEKDFPALKPPCCSICGTMGTFAMVKSDKVAIN